MGVFTVGRTGPGVLGRVLRIGALATTAAVPLTVMLVFSAGSAPAAGGGRPLAEGSGWPPSAQRAASGVRRSLSMWTGLAII